MTTEEFGKTIKAKYPQYQDLPDAELGQKMLTKFPQYNDLVKSPESAPATDTFLEGHPILKGISDILGTTGLAKGAAQGIFLKYTPEGKNLLDLVAKGQLKEADVEKIIGKTATTKEILASAVQTATTIATAGLGAAKGGSAGVRILETAGKVGGLSAIQGGAQAIGQDKTIPDVAKSALASGATGALLGGSGQAISELAQYLTSPHITEGIYNKALGIPTKAIEKGKSPSGMLINEGVSGTKKGILEKVNTIAQDSSKEVADTLKGNPATFASKEVLRQIESDLQQKFGNALSDTEIKSLVSKLPVNLLRSSKNVPVEELNALRSTIDNNFLGNAKWLNDSTVEKTLALKTATNVMRNLVQGTDEKLPALFERWSKAITASRALTKNLAKPHIITNLLEIMGSLVYGGATGGLTPEGLKNSLEAFAVSKAAETGLPQTLAARGLNAIGKGLGTPVASTLGQAAKIAIPGIVKNIKK